MISLRPAISEDLERILAWRNAPGTVRVSKSGRPLTIEQATAAYRGALAGNDPRRKVWMIWLDSQRPFGYLRLDFQPDGSEAEISIALDPGFQKKGYGTKILKDGCADLFLQHQGLAKITAVVMETNEASVKAFSRAGFVRVQTDGAFATYELIK